MSARGTMVALLLLCFSLTPLARGAEIPPLAGTRIFPNLLARAPSKRWGELPSVRLNVTIGGIHLNGQFLIHSGVPESVFSPVWLQFQGIPTDWLAQRSGEPQLLAWSAAFNPEGIFAYQGRPSRVEMAGHVLPLAQFRVLETEFAEYPSSRGACCDGIIGVDVLKSTVLELRNSVPFEVIAWKDKDFDPGPDFVAIPVTLDARGEPVSACELQSASGAKLRGVQWNTGQEETLILHEPHRAQLSALRKGWSLSCPQLAAVPGGPAPSGALAMGKGSGAARPEFPYWLKRGAQVTEAQSNPAVSVGMPLLARGRIIWDLPHGKLWFERAALARPLWVNTTGLTVDFTDLHSDRLLIVKAIAPGSRAARVLGPLGLRVGDTIQKIDGLWAHDLDYGEVEHRLAGAEGARVRLEWKRGGAQAKDPVVSGELPTL